MNLIIVNPCYISISHNELIEISIKNINEKRTFNASTIDFLILENDQSTISFKAINLLTNNNVPIIICNEQHLPSSQIISIFGNYPRKHHIYTQIDLSKEFKDELWQTIIKLKIFNQINVMKILNCNLEMIEKCELLKELIEVGDASNREGTTSRLFFRSLYGSQFIRSSDSAINNALNYGYAILASTLATHICSHGLVPMLGIHHCNKFNTWNLVYDLIEIIRPIIDYWVASHVNELQEKLTTINKMDLIDILKSIVFFDNQNRKLKSAIKDYVASFVKVINEQNINLLKIPKIIKQEW